MYFSLIICTYHRPEALKRLLASIAMQSIHPNEIIIVDGSLDNITKDILAENSYLNLKYFKVTKQDRGLTRQRNYGISKVSKYSEVIFFLDDDTVASSKYCEEILKVYRTFPEALGVAGYITNETSWKKVNESYQPDNKEFYFEGWVRKEGARFSLRRKFGLEPDEKPGIMPDFSHGYSIGFLPPNGKIYEVELLMGGVASYRREVFDHIKFSKYFEGYGLYEDADFSLRTSKLGKLYVNTAAKIEHHHDLAGRPNKFRYGKMVVRNGWYVWRIKNPHPSLKARLKWNSTSLLLTLVRLGNIVNTKNRKEAITESLGRILGWFSLIITKPIIEKDG